MTALRYVCLSDTHLGAAYSTLTRVDPNGQVDPATASDALTALGQALQAMLPLLGDGPPPTLVLLGDVLDLGLSPMGEVTHAFRRFVESVMVKDGVALFAPRVLYVPGNHDHHLWRMAQDTRFLDGLREGRVEYDLIVHTNCLEGTQPSPLRSEWLTQVLAMTPGLQASRVEIVYPNLGLLNADRTRCVVLHHGHYVDATYRVMSTINQQLTGKPPLSVSALEGQNGPWVDFLWSDLGSAGVTGAEATTLYEVMRDAAASHAASQSLSDWVVAQLGSNFGISPEMVAAEGLTVKQLVLAAVDATVGRGSQSQRDDYLALMSAADIADLRWFVSGPVATQLTHEGVDIAKAAFELSFVFGHTHKPFQGDLPVSGFQRPVAVYNTGGWVMDQPTMSTTQGGAAVFIDDELNIASLRLFNDPLNGQMGPVAAAGTSGFRDRTNPMLAALTAAVSRTEAPWANFSAAMLHATESRAMRLLTTFTGQDIRDGSIAS